MKNINIDVSVEKALQIYRQLWEATENGRNAEVKRERDGNLKVYTVDKKIVSYR